ncbi:MAG: hypothetical protein JWQ29_1389, partial [Phenylobacterium sp.]|nr:hypothetical protein [Phenylobacterium sp.]
MGRRAQAAKAATLLIKRAPAWI